MVILTESSFTAMDCSSNSLEDLEVTFKKLIEMGNNTDMWEMDYAMPLTPPLSPITSFESTSSVSTECDCHRYQPLCPSFSKFASPGCVAQKFDSMVLKDCMWGFAKPIDQVRQSSAPITNTLQSTSANFENSKLIGVDPTEVFPPSLFERVSNSDFADSDDDSDVDVVTVDTDSDRSDDFDNFPMLSPPRSPESEPEDLPGKQTKVNFIIPIRLATSVANVVKDNNIKATSERKYSSTRSSAVQRKQVSPERNTPRFKRSHHLGLDTIRLSRASHNVLERRRRNELKQKFYSLRDSLPEAKRNDKVPKVTILRNAIDYIAKLQAEGNSLDFEAVQLRKNNSKLKARLLALLKKQKQ